MTPEIFNGLRKHHTRYERTKKRALGAGVRMGGSFSRKRGSKEPMDHGCIYSMGGGSMSVITSATPATPLAMRTISFSKSGSARMPETVTLPLSLRTLRMTLRVFGEMINAACTRKVVV